MNFDCIIIGGGTGGTTAAKELANHGIKTALIEKDKIGGTCLHRGCIPSKFLAHIRDNINESEKMKKYINNISDFNYADNINWEKIKDEKNSIIRKLQGYLETALKKADIEVFSGNACISSKNSIKVQGNEQINDLSFKNLIIATGSAPLRKYPFEVNNNAKIFTSEEFFDMDYLPASLIIIGAGVIGVEIASILISFGVKTTILEKEDRLFPFLDKASARYYESLLKRNGINIIKSANVNSIGFENGSSTVSYKVGNKGNAEKIKSEAVLITMGRVPLAKDIGLEKFGVHMERAGFINVDNSLKTEADNVFAIGDCISTPALAHQASYEAGIAVHNILNPGNAVEIDTNLTPYVIFATPELGFIGQHEDDLALKGIKPEIIRKPFAGLGKALAIEDIQGQLKLIFDNGRLKGATVIGKYAGELINILSIAVKHNLTKEEIKDVIFPHPTMSEIIYEALE